MSAAPLDLAAIRRRLAGRRGHAYWRSLEELAETPGFLDLLHHEFPREADRLAGAVDRRQFLRLMSASLALAGLGGACTRQPEERIVPYVRQPREIVLGQPLFFATAMPLAGPAVGLLVESHEGHPTKVEGNPDHPASLGASDAIAQASVLGLYDPDRSQVITNAGEIRPWGAFRDAVAAALESARRHGGAGLRLLTETVTSPTLARQIRELLQAFPRAVWHQWEPAGRDAARAGARLAFGTPVDTHYRFEPADVVLALDADFLAGPAGLRPTRELMRRRRPPLRIGVMNRLYVVESTPSVTGSVADHRLPLRSADVDALARAVAQAIGVRLAAPADPGALPEAERRFVEVVARDLARSPGRCAVIPGDGQPASVHALAHAMNAALRNVGGTVVYTEPVEAAPVDQSASLGRLVADMDAGDVETLLVVGGNPVYTAPADLGFAEHLQRVGLRIHLSLYDDETSALCHWHVPEAHFLESWSDTRAPDGTATVIQPLIAPLYGGHSAHEVLAAFSDQPDRSAYDLVRETWGRRHPGPDFETFWRTALHDGVIPNTAARPRGPVLRADWDRGSLPPAAAGGLELVFRPDPYVFDGRFANNGWLQELPQPITKLTWDNAALVAPATAERLGLANGDVVDLAYGGRTVRAPVWIVPGHAPEAVTVHLGYGRVRAGTVGDGVGFDAYRLRTAAAPWFGAGLEVRRTGARHALATTQEHQAMEGRDLVRRATLAEYRADPAFARDPHAGGGEHQASLYPPHEYAGHAWGMAIDLGSCIGCNACVAACQAENNIPVVGKDQVARGREMHWLRVDRYFAGDLDAPAILHQPVPCMHCENAPCELVCPVQATVHSSEGLNDMVYNRCVGTRYCSNNCPYKVRRFNFYLYADWTTASFDLLRNPEVTVRSCGVMEKCTYCVQRIEHARMVAAEADRPIRDGEIVTACQQACPAEAIVFGDVNDPKSRVSRLKAEQRNYAILAELNTRPRTTYLAAVTNPSPALDAERSG